MAGSCCQSRRSGGRSYCSQRSSMALWWGFSRTGGERYGCFSGSMQISWFWTSVQGSFKISLKQICAWMWRFYNNLRLCNSANNEWAIAKYEGEFWSIIGLPVPFFTHLPCKLGCCFKLVCWDGLRSQRQLHAVRSNPTRSSVLPNQLVIIAPKPFLACAIDLAEYNLA